MEMVYATESSDSNVGATAAKQTELVDMMLHGAAELLAMAARRWSVLCGLVLGMTKSDRLSERR